jgi:hypothetical protein
MYNNETDDGGTALTADVNGNIEIVLGVGQQAQDITQLMQRITASGTVIDLIGCGTATMAEQLAYNLGNKATVFANNTNWVFGIRWTGFVFRPFGGSRVGFSSP